MPDISFDSLVSHFKNKISNNVKGELRNQLAQHHMVNQIPELKRSPLNVVDLGAGLGEMTRWFQGMGHQVLYNDLSTEMANEAIKKLGLDFSNVHIGPLQELASNKAECFDVVHLQAVLEWMQDPKLGFDAASELVKPGGYLIVSFFNVESIVINNLLKGNLRKASSEEFKGDGKGLTPINPLKLSEVQYWLNDLPLECLHIAGLRCFVDYMRKDVPIRDRMKDILELEIKHSTQLPYLQMARYIQIICRKR